MLGRNKPKADPQADQIKQYQDMMKNLGEQFDTAKKDLAAAQARVKQLESDIATLKRDDIAEDQKYEQRLKAAQAETQKHVAEAQTAKNEAAAAKRELQQLQARIKQLEDQLDDVPAGGGQSGGGQGAPDRPAIKYTVVGGDTLRAIAQRFYGNEMEYMRIFHANRDQLDDPDLIRPGQVLNVP
jgi:nucleoid-associated protein YgaU